MIRLQGRCELLGDFALLIDSYDEEEQNELESTGGEVADCIGFEVGGEQLEFDFDGEPLEE